MEVLLGDGIFNVDGELWRKQRKTASFEFASKNLRDFSTVVFRDYSLNLSSILSQASINNQEVDMQVTQKNVSATKMQLHIYQYSSSNHLFSQKLNMKIFCENTFRNK